MSSIKVQYVHNSCTLDKDKWLEYRTRKNFQVASSNLTAGHLQATLSKLLTYGVLTSTQPPTLRGTGNE